MKLYNIIFIGVGIMFFVMFITEPITTKSLIAWSVVTLLTIISWWFVRRGYYLGLSDKLDRKYKSRR